MKAVIYARTNLDDKAAITAQVNECRKWLDARGAYGGAYIDDGVSGHTSDRPALIELLEDGRKKQFDTVIVAGPSEIGTDDAIFQEIVEALEARHLHLDIANFGYINNEHFDLKYLKRLTG